MSDIKKIDIFKHEGDLYQVIPPTPSENERGGIIASPKTEEYTTEVKIGDNGKLYTPSFATEEYVDSKMLEYLTPPPAVTSYTKPTSIPIMNGTQLVFYASSAGTFTFKFGKETYTHELENQKDCGWVLWAQTTDTDGSLISQGSRSYLMVGEVVKEIEVIWSPVTGTSNPNWIVITIN